MRQTILRSSPIVLSFQINYPRNNTLWVFWCKVSLPVWEPRWPISLPPFWCPWASWHWAIKWTTVFRCRPTGRLGLEPSLPLQRFWLQCLPPPNTLQRPKNWPRLRPKKLKGIWSSAHGMKLWWLLKKCPPPWNSSFPWCFFRGMPCFVTGNTLRLRCLYPFTIPPIPRVVFSIRRNF